MNFASVSSAVNWLHGDCIRASSSASPREWHTQPLVRLSALIVSLLIYFLLWRKKMHHREESPSPFLELPRELRDMCYEHLLEDPCYPPKLPERHPQSRNSLRWVLPGSNSVQKSPSKQRTSIFLVNRQTYHEFMDLLYKHSKFTLSVSPDTYSPGKKIWNIAPETIQRIRKCDIKLVTTSDMLGVPDPRDMTSGSWPLAAQIRHELRPIKNVTELNLHVHTIGDPLWNPLWVWYHASQSFKVMGSGEKNNGPKLNRITFSLDTWSPGENYLERDEHGQWYWWCKDQHEVALDGDMNMTVREFCARLYGECPTCKGHDDEEE